MEWRELQIYKATTKTYELVFSYEGNVQSIEDWTIYFSCKTNMTDANAVIEKTITSHTDAVNGETEITLSKTDTNISAGNYYYEISYLDDEGNEEILYIGRLTIKERVK